MSNAQGQNANIPQIVASAAINLNGEIAAQDGGIFDVANPDPGTYVITLYRPHDALRCQYTVTLFRTGAGSPAVGWRVESRTAEIVTIVLTDPDGEPISSDFGFQITRW